jgi:tRNA threonylcarbamoyladenosine biosynthesis protein TsaB
VTLILAIESAGDYFSIALQSDNKTLFSSVLFLPHAHSQLSSSLIIAGIESIGKKMSDLDAVAVGSGPGSYTGLRIGLSVAKGICFGCDVPLISVGGLENMAFNMKEKFPHVEVFVTCIPARKDEFFYAVFLKDGTPLVSPQVGKSVEIYLNDILSPFSSIVVVGKNARDFASICGIPGSALVDETIEPLVEVTGRMAYHKWLAGKFENVALFEPAYLKPVYISGR